jgi:zinc transport system substrate-binding protein
MRAVLTIGFVLLLTACTANGSSDGSSTPGTLSVVAAFYPVQEAAERAGGDLVEVTNLTPPGVEPHDLELTPHAIEAIQTADVVLYLGDGFQPAVQEALADAEGLTVDLLAGLKVAPPPPGEADELDADPHVWLDPPLYAQMVDAVENAFASAAPDDADTFRRNADGFNKQIEALNADYTSGLRDCRSTTIVTNHAAFGYLAQQYGLTQEAISGLAPDAEPSARRLAELNDLVRREGVTTIFTEELVSPRVAETLADEAGVQTKVLFTLEGLTPDEIAAGDDYDSVMRENLATLEAALDCG